MTHGVCKVRTVWFLLFYIFAVFTPERRKDNNKHHQYLGAFIKLRKESIGFSSLSVHMERLGSL
jgi:hypothetical protein